VERVLEWTVAIKVARAKVRTSSRKPPQKRFVNITGARLRLSRYEGWLRCGLCARFRLPIFAIVTALALSAACARPVLSPWRRRRRSRFHGLRPAVQFTSSVVVSDSGGGAIAALRASFAGPPGAYAAVPSAYAEAPLPVRYDGSYRLDAGDRLRVVVYGQDGLTNTYAIDAGGRSTMPLIRSGAGARAHPAGLASDIIAKLATAISRTVGRGGDRSLPVRLSSSAKVAAPGQFPTCPI